MPEKTRLEKEKLPPQLAEIILKKVKPKPPPPVPVPEPEMVEAKPDAEKPPEEVVQAPVPQTVKQARDKAKVSGLLAFSDQLAALRELAPVDALNDTASLSRGEGVAAKVDRAMLTAKKGGRRANVNAANLSSEVGGVALSAAESTVVEAPEEFVAKTGAVRLANVDDVPHRSIEDVRRVFDANKGAIYAIYNRALRQEPGLVGKVVLELVIEPDGTVSMCDVLSTDLESQEMLKRLIRRVQLFDFGERSVASTKISYPVHFLPS